MVVADVSQTHREDGKEGKEKDPVRLGLRANVNPDTLPFIYAKVKHALTFTVENTGESMEIFKIKTTASYLYRIRPVFFKLGIRERQEVTVTFKGTDAGPIPLSAKDRITVVFAHALDPKKSTSALWELHKPFAHLSYAESREYVRVLFVDETGRLAVHAAKEKSLGGLRKLEQRGAKEQKDQRSITARIEPPKKFTCSAASTEDNNQDNAENEDAPSNAPPPPPPVQQRTPRKTAAAAGATRTPSKMGAAPRTPSYQQQSPKEARRSGPLADRRSRDSRDPLESLLSSVTKDASAIVCVYPGRDEGSTGEEEDTRREDDTKKKDMDTDDRREEVMRKKMEEMLIREEASRKKNEQKKKEEKRKGVERKSKEESKEEKKKKEEARKKKEQARKEEEEEAAEDEKAASTPKRRTSSEEVKQEQTAEESPVKAKRLVLGADGQYHDDDSTYLDEEARRQNSGRLIKKGATRAGNRVADSSIEDDKPARPPSVEDDN